MHFCFQNKITMNRNDEKTKILKLSRNTLTLTLTPTDTDTDKHTETHTRRNECHLTSKK